MRRVAFFILVACSFFTVGVIAFLSWHFISGPSSATIPPASIISSVVGANNRRYERGPAGLATRGSFMTLNSSDGMSFTKWSVYCRSPRHAAIELRKRTRKAVEIFSREPVVDEKGQQIGEKLLALFSRNDSTNALASLLWTENEEFFQVEGSSIQNILEYRKDFHR